MHIPDGYLSTPIWAGMDAVSLASVGFAVRRLNRTLDSERVPLMGMAGAFIFAAQMVNFPVAVGTSGHLLGGFLAALLLGPLPAIVVMTTVFVVQCLLFQDGGVLALGANLFNMGIVGCVGGYLCYMLMRRARLPEGFSVGAAAWLSVMLGAAAAALELGASGTFPLRFVMPAMLGVHALIGIGEAANTLAAFGLVVRVRPALVKGRVP